MDHYIVFTGRKWKNAVGQTGITWEIAGVWAAQSAEDACLIAAQKESRGTCFAIKGFAWGVDTIDAGDVTELGGTVDPITRLERMGKNLGERLERVLAPPSQARELDEGDTDG